MKKKQVIRLNENQLKNIVSKAIKRIVKEDRTFRFDNTPQGIYDKMIRYNGMDYKNFDPDDYYQGMNILNINESEMNYDEEDLNDFVSQYDEEGTVFSVKQYRCVVKNGFKHYDTVVNETNLTKQEAWELFKSLTIKAVKEAFSNNKLTYYCDNYDYLCLPTVYTNISTIYGDKTVRFPDSPEWSIASNVYCIKNDHPEYNWEEYCNNLLRKAKNSFFAGKYEYTSY